MEREPLDAGDPLMTVPNLILTPHSAYYSARSMETLRRETWVDVLTALAGGSPRTVVRPPAG
jgi:D-3-phosphoglycerate dehydrogenase / 2-oxoglutarate reductase